MRNVRDKVLAQLVRSGKLRGHVVDRFRERADFIVGINVEFDGVIALRDALRRLFNAEYRLCQRARNDEGNDECEREEYDGGDYQLALNNIDRRVDRRERSAYHKRAVGAV